MSLKSIIIIFLFIPLFLEANMIKENEVANSAENICPVKVGSAVPDAEIKTVKGEAVRLKDIINNVKTVLIFYRGGWCPYCNLHLSEIQQVEGEIIGLGYKIIAVSMDSPAVLSNTFEKQNINYELYSDSKAEACKAFGIAFRVEDEYIAKLKSYDMDIEALSGESHHILPVPSVFIIDEKGIIKFQYINPNYKERINGALLLSAAKVYNNTGNN